MNATAPAPLASGGLILDMDGVLADTEPLQAMAWVKLLARYGVALGPEFFDRWIGIPNMETARDIVARWDLPRSPDELVAEREPLYFDLVDGGLRPFPGIAERLDALRVPMAVATSGRRDEATRVLERLGFLHLFRGIVTADDVSRTKPDPEPYVRAAGLLDRVPRACVAIEDSPSGVSAARAAGCRVLAVTTTHPRDRLAEAHEIHVATAAALDAARAALGAPGRGGQPR